VTDWKIHQSQTLLKYSTICKKNVIRQPYFLLCIKFYNNLITALLFISNKVIIIVISISKEFQLKFIFGINFIR